MGLSRPIDDAINGFVHRAFIHHLVLVFREQTLSPESQIAFSRGLLSIGIQPADEATHPGRPELLLVLTGMRAGNYVDLPDVGPMWHSDIAYKERTALWSMLFAIEVLAHSVS